MNLRDHLEKLHYFKVVAELGSIHKASEALRIAQPSLSSSIRILEEAIGKELFIRNHKGVQLNQNGHILYEFSSKFFADLKEIEFKLARESESYEGHLKLGFYESIAIYYWPHFMNIFAKKYPLIGLSLSSARSTYLLDRLTKRDLDFIVSVEPLKSKNIYSEILYEDTFQFFTCNYRIKGNAPISKSDLLKVPFILFSSAKVQGSMTLTEYLGRNDILPTTIYQVESFEAAAEMALQGLGVAVLPNRVAVHRLKQLDQAGQYKIVKVNDLNQNEFGKHQIVASCLIENSEKIIFKKLFEVLRNLEPDKEAPHQM